MLMRFSHSGSGPRLQQHVQLRRHEAGAPDMLLLAQARQVLRVSLAAGRRQQQHAPARERIEQLLHRRVEADGRLLQEHVARPQLHLPADMPDSRQRPCLEHPTETLGQQASGARTW